MTSVLDKHGGIQTEDTGLIGMRNIGEDNVYHGNDHSVFLGVTGVLNDGDHIGALLGHVNEVPTASL